MNRRLRGQRPVRCLTGSNSSKPPQPKPLSVAGWPCRGGRLQAILIPGVGVLDRGDALGEDDSAAGTSSRTSRFLPGIHVLRHYRRAWLRGDVVAGCTVAAYLVPQVMAYAEVAGLPPVTGLWAVMGPLLVYAVLGSSRQLSVGPESTTALDDGNRAWPRSRPVVRCRGTLLRLWRLPLVQCAWSAGWLGWGFWRICCPIRF